MLSAVGPVALRLRRLGAVPPVDVNCQCLLLTLPGRGLPWPATPGEPKCWKHSWRP